MNNKITMQELRNAMRLGRWQLEQDAMFYSRRVGDNLKRPEIVIKSGVVVEVLEIYRRGRAALLRHVDASGQAWLSWTHASHYEKPRKYTRRTP